MKDDKVNDMNICAMWLIKNLCLDTNAETATITQENVHGPGGKNYGDYEIVIRKVTN
jgi:hypothetical protein